MSGRWADDTDSDVDEVCTYAALRGLVAVSLLLVLSLLLLCCCYHWV